MAIFCSGNVRSLDFVPYIRGTKNRFSAIQVHYTKMALPVEKYIGTTMRIKLVNERTLDGILTVVDPFGNLLLSNVYETFADKIKPSQDRRRELGLVSVPRARILQVLIDQGQAQTIKS